MTPEDPILKLLREALFLVLVCSAPPVLASLVVGFVVSLFQATTQLQEQTLTFVPKIIAVFASLAIAGPWIAQQMSRFMEAVLNVIPSLAT